MITTLISIFILLLFSAFFSGSETGLTAASRAKIFKLKTEGNRRADMVSRLRKKKDVLIGTILLGNNAVNILASALATSLAIEYYGQEGVFYVTAVMTLLVLIFAEVMPKTFAFQYAESVALAVAPIFRFLIIVLRPFTWIIQWISNGVLRLIGSRHHHGTEGTDALRGAIALHHEEGDVVKDDRDMLGSILDLGEMEVSEIMRHRNDIEMVNLDNSTDDIINQVLNSSYTRLPVWENNPDNVVGILHSKALVRAFRERKGRQKIDIRAIMYDPWFIPETTTLRDQLYAFREKHSHFALVVDEYGVLLGMITLEDILEEIVGQIDDEYDVKAQTPLETVDGAYSVPGDMTIRDLNRELDWDLPDEDASTVAGLLIHEAELIPDPGQVFHFHGYRFEVMSKIRNRITTIRIKPLE